MVADSDFSFQTGFAGTVLEEPTTLHRASTAIQVSEPFLNQGGFIHPEAAATAVGLLTALTQSTSLSADAQPFVPSCGDLSGVEHGICRKHLREVQTADKLPETVSPKMDAVHVVSESRPRAGHTSAQFRSELSNSLQDYIMELVVETCGHKVVQQVCYDLLAPTLWENVAPTCETEPNESNPEYSPEANQMELSTGAFAISSCKADYLQAATSAYERTQCEGSLQDASDTAAISACENPGVVGPEFPLSDLLWGNDSIHEGFSNTLHQYLAPHNFPQKMGTLRCTVTCQVTYVI